MFPWLLVCLHSPALLFMLWLVLKIGLLIEEWLARAKWNLLQQLGMEAEGVILESEEYTGPGLRTDDPCFKGKYQFTDHRGKTRRYPFKNYCYDQYDILSSEISFDTLRATYHPGSTLKVRYLRAFPRIHYMIISSLSDEKEPG